MFRAWQAAFALVSALALVPGSSAFAADIPGVTATEVKVGGIFPFSGPASSIGLVGRGILAYVQSINDRGGINGRKINYIAYDDAYSPPKAVEHARKLVESDEVAFMFSQLGTPGNSATAKYLISKGVPGDRDRLRIEQVHQCRGFPADHDQPRQLRYRRENLRQVPDEDAAEREVRDPLSERRSRKGLRQCLQGASEGRLRQEGRGRRL